jgi:hypothetical protein
MDLLALGGQKDQLTKELTSDLNTFGSRVAREMADLPDGPPLASFCTDICGLKASRVPSSFRTVIANLKGDRSSSEVVAAMEALEAHLATCEPDALNLPDEVSKDTVESKKTVVTPKAAPVKKRRRSTVVSDERAEWISADVLSRVVNYGNRGLKEHVIVAGSRHRSPFSDLTEAEVLAVLRRMKREGRLRHSAGRWMMP